MKKLLIVSFLIFILSACGENVLNGKFDDLSKNTQKEINLKYSKMVIEFRGKESGKIMAMNPSNIKAMLDEKKKLDSAVLVQFNLFKEKYKNIDFTDSSFMGMCNSYTTEVNCIK